MNVTQIKEVSVYRSGAYITRFGLFGLKEGKQTILIEGLSESLDPSTLTVSLNKDVSGSNIHVERYTPEKQNEIKKEILDSLKKVQTQIQTRKDQIEILKKNTDFSNRESVSLKDMNEFIDAFPKKIDMIYEQIASLEEEEAHLKKQYEEKQKEARSYLVKIDLDTKTAGSYPVALRYFERNACWNPNYEIRAEEDENIRVLLKAQIIQNTREEWNGVKVTLFTGDPSTSADIPKLYPQQLSFHRPEINGMRFAGTMKAAMAVQRDVAAEEMADYEAMEETMETVSYGRASVNENETMMEYDLEGLHDISNTNPFDIELTARNVSCRYHVIAVPKADPYGYLAAEVRSEDLSDLLNSNANIFYRDTFLGNVFLNVDPSKETYDISLGKDEGIRLKRTQKKRLRSNVLLKGQTKTEFEYAIEVSSTKSRDVKITLKDQIPVSNDKTIQVETADLSEGKLDEKTGEIVWEFDLPGSATKSFTLAYDVAWPKDKELSL